MSFVRNISFAALAIAFAVQADIIANADVPSVADAGLDVSSSSIDAGLDTPLAVVGLHIGADKREDINLDVAPIADLDLDLPLAIPDVPTIPARHRKGKRQLEGLLSSVSGVFGDLESAVTPLIANVESTLSDLSGDAEKIVSSVESDLKSIVAAVTSATSGLGGLTDVTQIVPLRRNDPTAQAIAGTAQGVLSTVSGLLQEVNSAAASVPGLGPVLSTVTTDLESALSSLLNTLGQVAAPVLAVLNSLLAPLESTLNEVGLGSVVSLVQGLLGSL